MTTFRRQLGRAFLRLAERHSVKTAARALAVELIRRRRTRDIDLLAQTIIRLWSHLQNHVEAEVVTARTMDPATLAELRSWLRRRATARSVSLQTRLDREIIGGFVITTPDEVIDYSLRSKLEALKSA